MAESRANVDDVGVGGVDGDLRLIWTGVFASDVLPGGAGRRWFCRPRCRRRGRSGCRSRRCQHRSRWDWKETTASAPMEATGCLIEDRLPDGAGVRWIFQDAAVDRAEVEGGGVAGNTGSRRPARLGAKGANQPPLHIAEELRRDGLRGRGQSGRRQIKEGK